MYRSSWIWSILLIRQSFTLVTTIPTNLTIWPWMTLTTMSRLVCFRYIRGKLIFSEGWHFLNWVLQKRVCAGPIIFLLILFIFCFFVFSEDFARRLLLWETPINFLLLYPGGSKYKTLCWNYLDFLDLIIISVMIFIEIITFVLLPRPGERKYNCSEKLFIKDSLKL